MISIYGYDLPAWFSPPETSIASIIYAKLLTLGLLPPLKRDSNPRSGNNQINYQFNDHWSRLWAATFRKCGKFSPPNPPPPSKNDIGNKLKWDTGIGADFTMKGGSLQGVSWLVLLGRRGEFMIIKHWNSIIGMRRKYYGNFIQISRVWKGSGC